jgi:hypothetical protein
MRKKKKRGNPKSSSLFMRGRGISPLNLPMFQKNWKGIFRPKNKSQ